MLPRPDDAAPSSTGSAGQGSLAVTHESFDARFRDLRFLEGAGPCAVDAPASDFGSCDWIYGCLRSMPDWFDRYVASGANIRDQPSSYGVPGETAVHLVLDRITSVVHTGEADTMVRTAHPVPAPLATDSLTRSFGVLRCRNGDRHRTWPRPDRKPRRGHSGPYSARWTPQADRLDRTPAPSTVAAIPDRHGSGRSASARRLSVPICRSGTCCCLRITPFIGSTHLSRYAAWSMSAPSRRRRSRR